MIEVTKLSTFERELNSAAPQGFRLMRSTASEDGQRIEFIRQLPSQLRTANW